MYISLCINEETALFTCWNFLIRHEEAVARTLLEYFHFMLLNTSTARHCKVEYCSLYATGEGDKYPRNIYMSKSKHIVLKYYFNKCEARSYGVYYSRLVCDIRII